MEATKEMTKKKKIVIILLAGCKESHFYSLIFGQAEHLLAQTSFQLAPKMFWWADWLHSSSVIWIPQKTSLAHWAS